jgi:MscS family membrane protein
LTAFFIEYILLVMNDLHVLLNQSFLDNTLWQYANLLMILIAGLLFKRFISRLSGRLLFRMFRSFAEDVQVEKFLELMHRPVSNTIMIVVLFFAFSQIDFPPHWNLAPKAEFGIRFLIHKAYFVFLYGSIIWVFLRIADFLSVVMQVRAEKIDNRYSGQIIPFLIDSVKIIIVIFGGLIILGSVFDLNVGALVTGLGIGGLAIALAAKETLENLLGSFTIFLDRPFVVGDMVRVAGITGVVEKVGFRSTRLRTLEKSFVTLPNKKMIDSELDNLTMRTFRRGDLTIGLTYSTSTEQLKAIVADIQDYIDNHPNTNQEGKVRFHDFGQSSLNIMVLFFVDTMDWTNYLDIKQEILYEIIDIVKKHGSGFAFPSTSIYIEKNQNTTNS